MATVYKVEFEVVSDFCAYSEEELKRLLKIKMNLKDNKNGLTLRVSDINVKQER